MYICTYVYAYVYLYHFLYLRVCVFTFVYLYMHVCFCCCICVYFSILLIYFYLFKFPSGMPLMHIFRNCRAFSISCCCFHRFLTFAYLLHGEPPWFMCLSYYFLFPSPYERNSAPCDLLSVPSCSHHFHLYIVFCFDFIRPRFARFIIILLFLTFKL